jgi:outer membrane protein assembly factor BamE (lipoprotein component of BamABCDE complex)
MIPSISFAKIYYDTDKFDNSKWYYTTDMQDKGMFNFAEPYYRINTTFKVGSDETTSLLEWS